ncbi:hypothetical protein RHSIM_Rhsim01G0057500 [Rhododendron simsii]|uniref:H(+)-exporting diphosphatase n=1 Tax=Rhododendron simsii TaxID=118357 RepID=A0A834M005_RHOSS|nr:hypothetical protein RHSIM_Rhsim01G0057500 [Rhododendron simsii]
MYYLLSCQLRFLNVHVLYHVIQDMPLGSGGIHGKAADVGANITDKVIADNDRDIAGILVCLRITGSGGSRAKAADVGADIIDKVERSIPDDDPRIERFFYFFQVVADIVGKIVGMGYDLVGFYAESTCAALVFGSISSFGINHNCNALSFAH